MCQQFFERGIFWFNDSSKKPKLTSPFASDRILSDQPNAIVIVWAKCYF